MHSSQYIFIFYFVSLIFADPCSDACSSLAGCTSSYCKSSGQCLGILDNGGSLCFHTEPGCDDTVLSPVDCSSLLTTPVPTDPSSTAFVCSDSDAPRVGLFVWDMADWLNLGSSNFINFLQSNPDALNYYCNGDFYIVLADYSFEIYEDFSVELANFVQAVHAAGFTNSVIYLTYVDENANTHDRGSATEDYTEYAVGLIEDVVGIIGHHVHFGLLYHVWNIDPSFVRTSLQRADFLRQNSLVVDPSYIHLQWSVSAETSAVNAGTILQYADYALYLLYRNFYHPVSVKGLNESNNFVNRLLYLLSTQLPDVFDGTSTSSGKISFMIDVSCSGPSRPYCYLSSFCALLPWGMPYVLSTFKTSYDDIVSQLTDNHFVKSVVLNDFNWATCYTSNGSGFSNCGTNALTKSGQCSATYARV